MKKMIHLELYMRLKLNNVNKWYMDKPESVLENETHKILRDFEMQTDHQNPARRPNFHKKIRTYN